MRFVRPPLETIAQLNCNPLAVADTPKPLLFPLLLVGRQDGPCKVIESRVLGFTQASSLEVIIKVPQESSQQQIFVHVMNKNFVGRYKQQSFSAGTKMDRVHIDACPQGTHHGQRSPTILNAAISVLLGLTETAMLLC